MVTFVEYFLSIYFGRKCPTFHNIVAYVTQYVFITLSIVKNKL